MKKSLEKLTNRLHKNAIHQLFGDGSVIQIDSINYLTTKKRYHVIAILNPTDADKTANAYPYGVEYLIIEAWRFINITKEEPIISVSIITK